MKLLDRKIMSPQLYTTSIGIWNREPLLIAPNARTCLLPLRSASAASPETCERECGVPNGESVDL